eukprot:TRINITY_DN1913_c0_g1_i1.p2 TRINITY_DN1913_c0_g1~~TRINITY_DN1913_c0_g1_i1.p2  ORF type:complete len:235 (+),score=55.20 TRINITY_DN1913_c0_g1_i1:1040-1744(+)
MVDLSDPEVKKAYESVRDDSGATSWAWFRYHPSKTALQVHTSGSGGWSDFLKPIDISLPMYGFCRYNWEERGRTKFIFVSFIGEKVPALKKARIGHDKATVTNFFKGSHITLEADCVGDLEESVVIDKLRRSGGADYDGGGRTTGAVFGQYKAEAQKTFDKPATQPSQSAPKPVTPTVAPTAPKAEPAPSQEAVTEEPVQQDAAPQEVVNETQQEAQQEAQQDPPASESQDDWA